MSLRRFSVLAHHLPHGAAVYTVPLNAPMGWTLTDQIATDQFAAWTGEQHPLRDGITQTVKREQTREQIARLDDHRRRMEQRAQRLAAQQQSDDPSD